MRLVGTGSILTSALSACALVNDRILVDVPNGAVKTLRRQGVEPGSLDACLITHFHADHYFDVVFLLLELGLRRVRDEDFLLAGPRGLEERVDTLFRLAYPESWDKVRKNSRVKFHEWTDHGGEITSGGHTVRAVPVAHTATPAFGYLVGDGDATTGFSGDSELCDGVETIMRACSTAVLDASFIERRAGHMGVSDLVDLARRFPDVRVLATHVSDEVRGGDWPGVQVPDDGDRYSV
ncbi:MBL fold metallo-hydrolase [Actinosynnema sp. NPDC023794]